MVSRLYGLPGYKCKTCGYAGNFIIETEGDGMVPEDGRPFTRNAAWDQPLKTSRRKKILVGLSIILFLLVIFLGHLHFSIPLHW